MQIQCNVCEFKFEVPNDTKPGARITCPNCFAQLGLYKLQGKLYPGCALCKEPNFDPSKCEDCERRREKKKLYEEGTL